MKKINLISTLFVLILLVFSCELAGEDTYNNAYAQEWYKTTETVINTNWEVVKLDLSDQSFEMSVATLDSDANLSDYSGTSRGSITEIDNTALSMSVEEIFFDAGWYSKEDYINLQMDLGQSEAEAIALANNHFISTTINYTVSNDPETLTISGINDFSGTYFTSVMASVINS